MGPALYALAEHRFLTPGTFGFALTVGISKPWIWSQKARVSVLVSCIFSCILFPQVRQLKGHANAIVPVLVSSCRLALGVRGLSASKVP